VTAKVASLPDLNEAIQNANKALHGNEYTVVVASKDVNPKEPVFLQLRFNDGKTRNIGITHLVHLTGNDYDNMPFEAIARTTDEVTKAILERIALFFYSEAAHLHIDQSGTIFDFGEANVKLHDDKTFSIDGRVVISGGLPLLLSRIKSDGIVEFLKLKNGHIQLFDTLDEREGKGIFIDTMGKIYRA
jgi:hypothetical protein